MMKNDDIKNKQGNPTTSVKYLFGEANFALNFVLLEDGKKISR